MYVCMYIKKMNEERVLHSILYTCNCTNLAFSKNIYLHTIMAYTKLLDSLISQALPSFPSLLVLQVTESWAGPGNEASFLICVCGAKEEGLHTHTDTH